MPKIHILKIMNFNFKFQSSSVLDNENVIFFKLLIFLFIEID